jgi:Peptidase inhibitor I78 family
MQFAHATKAAFAICAIALSACNPGFDYAPKGTLPKPPALPTGHDTATNPQTCPAKQLQYLVGQSRTVLQTMRFGGEIRFEEPGQMYSQEYISTRTRIVIGAGGKIERIICG